MPIANSDLLLPDDATPALNVALEPAHNVPVSYTHLTLPTNREE